MAKAARQFPLHHFCIESGWCNKKDLHANVDVCSEVEGEAEGDREEWVRAASRMIAGGMNEREEVARSAELAGAVYYDQLL